MKFKILMLTAGLLLLGNTALSNEDKAKTESENTENLQLASPSATEPCDGDSAEQCGQQIEGLPPEAPRTGVVITVDTERNLAYLFRDGELVTRGPAATGSNKFLRRGLREWLFRTPHGRHKILRKVVDPVWVKPDWAFIEEGKKIPPPNSPKRRVKGKLGRYALDLGEGIMIHGTDDPKSLGRKVSHGCIRLGDEMLEHVYRSSNIGTEVHIF